MTSTGSTRPGRLGPSSSPSWAPSADGVTASPLPHPPPVLVPVQGVSSPSVALVPLVRNPSALVGRGVTKNANGQQDLWLGLNTAQSV